MNKMAENDQPRRSSGSGQGNGGGARRSGNRPAGNRSNSGGGGGFKAAPAKKTVQMHPAVSLAIFGSPILIIAIIGVLYVLKEKPVDDDANTTAVQEDPNKESKEIDRAISKCRKEYRLAMSLQDVDEKRAEFKKMKKKALESIRETLDRLDELTKDLRDENGELKDDYSGYREKYADLTEWNKDLYSVSGFGLDDD